MKKLLLIGIPAALLFIAIYYISDSAFLWQKPLVTDNFFERSAQILFVGDMFFDREIRRIMNEKGGDYIFSCIDDFLDDYDMVIGNLEGPITESPSVSLGSLVGSPQNFVFTFPTNTAKLLERHNIKVVNLGNNHIANFGKEGIASTHKYLEDAGIRYFGGIDGDEPSLHLNVDSQEISLISFNQFGGSPIEKVVEKVQREKEKGRMVVVFTHWSEEYVEPNATIEWWATMLSQAGADVIIGSHPHVITRHETIGNTHVYYSLGNFIFDQYWDKAVTTGLALEFVLKDNTIDTVREHRVSILRDGRTCLEEAS